ncbi:hypothetical protein [Micromonospora sp. NPDC047730]|uniref:hypothetical protein n=1 Tax=Micromonospora sp. NPDC047730 TaxID=3364253 RepID=UPI00371F0BE0
MIINLESPQRQASTYTPGTVQDAAERELRIMLEELRDEGKVEQYGRELRRAVVFTRAGNGPTCLVVFLMDSDGDPMSAFVDYSERHDAAMPVPEPYVQELYDALRAYGR